MAGWQVIRARPSVGAAVAVFAAIACGATFAVAANDPRGLDRRSDDLNRPSLSSPGPEPAGSLSSASPFKGNPLWGIPLESLRATHERPLFSPSRRPSRPLIAAPRMEPAKAIVREPERPPLNLLGVVTGVAEGYAVFVNTATHDVVRLKTGEGNDGWILQSVSAREAVLKKDNRSAVLALPQRASERR